MLDVFPPLLEPPGSRCRTRLHSIFPECKARPSKQGLPARSTAVPGISAFFWGPSACVFHGQAKRSAAALLWHAWTTMRDVRSGTVWKYPRPEPRHTELALIAHELDKIAPPNRIQSYIVFSMPACRRTGKSMKAAE